MSEQPAGKWWCCAADYPNHEPNCPTVTGDALLIEQLRALEIVAAIDAAGAAVENYCECGAAYSKHRYWDDKIYDVNGYRCPNQTFNRDYRYCKVRTERMRLEAKAAELAALLGPQAPHQEGGDAFERGRRASAVGSDQTAAERHPAQAKGGGTHPPTNTSAEAPEEPQTWQPIATAPKDERYLLLWCDAGFGGPVIGKWFIAAHDYGFWVSQAIEVTPSHWQPLPDPPTEDGAPR